MFNLEIAAGNKVLQQVPLTLNIVEAQTRAKSMGVNLKSGLTALLVLLILAGIVLAMMLVNGKKVPIAETEMNKTYY